MSYGSWVKAAGRGLLMGQLYMWARTLEPLMTDRGCNWPGGNNMPGSASPSRSFFAGRDRDTALATARLIASSHSNIIAVSMTDPITITAGPSVFGPQSRLSLPQMQ